MVKKILNKYGVPYYENEQATANGLCICIGSGMLMATMDEIHTCKYFIEYKDFKDDGMAYFWFPLVCSFVDYVFLNAWFSITKPEKLFYLLQSVDGRRLYAKTNVPFNRGTVFESFRAASDFLNDERNLQIER